MRPITFEEYRDMRYVPRRFWVEWISVDDRMPEPDEDVLVCTNKTEVCLGYYTGAYWIKYARYNTAIVTHWMPLPEPPK